MKYKDFYIESLIESFGSDQKKKWLKDNPELTSDQIDIYIKWFDELRKSKPAAAKTINIDGIPNGDDRFDISKYSDWHSFESFVDAVRAQTQLKGEKLSHNLEVIDGKPLFEKNGLEVYYADTPRACIKYKGSVPYSWCVSRTDSSNMFYSYRLRGNNPAFYFVKDVKATQEELSSGKTFSGKFSNKWHFFIIQVLKTANINNLTNKSYVVTSANNDGDISMSWNEIVEIQPKLHGLQSKFIPKPLSDEEISMLKYRKGLTFNEFIKLSYNEKERFLDVYPSLGRPITNEIFNALPYELKNKYIGMSIGLSDEQYESIQSDKNLLNRYVQIIKKKFEVWLTDWASGFSLVNSEIDVLRKYGILENHVNQLTDKYNPVFWLLKYSTDKQETIDTLLNINIPLTANNIETLLDYSTDKQETIDTLLKKNIPLTDRNVTILLAYSQTDHTKRKIDALKLKQQLSETKFRYRDFYKHLLHESMTATVSGKDYEQQDLQDLLSICQLYMQKVINPIFVELSQQDQKYFRDNRKAMDFFTPDGGDEFKSTGIINFYTLGFKPETVKTILDGVKYFASDMNIVIGSISEPEQSKIYSTSPVIRIVITQNNNLDNFEKVPEIQLSELSSKLIYGRLLALPDFEEGYTIAAIDLLKAIESVEKKDQHDDEFLYRYSNPTSVDANMITGGITPEYLRRTLGRLKELCNYAIDNDIKDIVIN